MNPDLSPLAAVALLAALIGPAPPATAQHLMVPDSSSDRILLFDAFDGSLVDPSFIDLSLVHAGPQIPIEALQVENEIWVSDQIADLVYRFSRDGETLLGTVGSGRDNVRGIEYAAGRVWVCNGGAPGGVGSGLHEYAPDGTLLANHPADGPFDVVLYGNELLVADVTSQNILRYALDGTPLGVFHDSDGVSGIDFPEQLSAKHSDGNLLAAGFDTPRGIFEFDPSGAQVAYVNLGGRAVRGVWELGNGELLFTDGDGVHRYRPADGAVTSVALGFSARFVSRLGDPVLGESYCIASPNSTGAEARIFATGSTSVSDNRLTLRAKSLPAGVVSIFFYGAGQAQTPLGNGFLCVGPGSVGTFRLPLTQARADGSLSRAMDLANPPRPEGLVTPGSTWNFQAWFRDPAALGARVDLSDGLSIAFTP